MTPRNSPTDFPVLIQLQCSQEDFREFLPPTMMFVLEQVSDCFWRCPARGMPPLARYECIFLQVLSLGAGRKQPIGTLILVAGALLQTPTVCEILPKFSNCSAEIFFVRSEIVHSENAILRWFDPCFPTDFEQSHFPFSK